MSSMFYTTPELFNVRRKTIEPSRRSVGRNTGVIQYFSRRVNRLSGMLR